MTMKMQTITGLNKNRDDFERDQLPIEVAFRNNPLMSVDFFLSLKYEFSVNNPCVLTYN